MPILIPLPAMGHTYSRWAWTAARQLAAEQLQYPVEIVVLRPIITPQDELVCQLESCGMIWYPEEERKRLMEERGMAVKPRSLLVGWTRSHHVPVAYAFSIGGLESIRWSVEPK